MKKNLLAALSLMVCFSTFSQEEVSPTMREKSASEQSPAPTAIKPEATPTKVVSKSKTQTISKRAGQPQQVHDAAYYQKEISVIDNNLAAIDQKIAYVNGNAQEKQTAEANGWFEQMDNIKAELLVKKAALQKKLANL